MSILITMIDELLRRYPLISSQVNVSELRVILRELTKALQINAAGDIVEFGCYSGTTSLFIQRLLGNEPATRGFHVYDSFEGLPTKGSADESPSGTQYRSGTLTASKKEFIRNFRKADLPLPIIHKGWFEELMPQDIPKLICFAFLDGDFYQSILTSLRLIWSFITNEAVIIVDDYQSEALPGAKKAVDQWLAAHTGWQATVECSLAIIRQK